MAELRAATRRSLYQIFSRPPRRTNQQAEVRTVLSKNSRREFLKRGSGAAATTAALATLAGVHAQTPTKPEKVNLGIIGCGGMMAGHVEGLCRRQSAVSLVWLCDVDPRQVDKLIARLSRAEESHGPLQSAKPKKTARYEDVVGDKNVDAVIIATPHHWHVPIALEAVSAGKDVYVEKPISHVYDEGKLLVAAAKRYGRIVQHGTQMRSSPVTQQAQQVLASGVIGEVRVARAWTAELRSVTRPVPDSPVPVGVDYDRWLGPAPVRPFNQRRFHGSWRRFRDYGNGEIGDDGIHDLDMARWGLGDPALPINVTSRGGEMLLHGDVGEYPDNMNVTYEYPDGRLLVYEAYPFTEYGMHGFDNGNVFYGSEGYMVFSRRGAFQTYIGPKREKGPSELRETRGDKGYDQHMEEFLTAVRGRTTTSASAEIAHGSCALVHLGEIAYRTQGHLEFDVPSERFISCDEANALLTKDYRDPYKLPLT